MIKYSLTRHHKAQEHKQQVTSYELLFGEFCVCFLRCDINNFPISHIVIIIHAFPIVVGGRGEKCGKSEILNFIFAGACDSPGVLAPNIKRML